MYDMEITELSRSYIIKLTNELGSDLCLIGGWAVYGQVTKGYEAETERIYIGSKDIDLGFHVDPDWSETEILDSRLLKTIRILTEELDFEPYGSYRFAKWYDRQTWRELSELESRTTESFNIHHLFVDLLVDYSFDTLNELLGFTPIDESLLAHYFNASRNRTFVSLGGVEVPVPTVPLLLAMKVRTIPRRQETHKREKDLADSFALLRFTDWPIDELKSTVFSFIDKSTIDSALQSIISSDYQRVGTILGVSSGEVRTVLYSLIA